MQGVEQATRRSAHRNLCKGMRISTNIHASQLRMHVKMTDLTHFHKPIAKFNMHDNEKSCMNNDLHELRIS